MIMGGTKKGMTGRIAMLILLAMLIISGCSTNQESQAPQLSNEEPSHALGGMVLRESQAGLLRWVMAADSAFQISEAEPTQLIRIHIDFYNDTGDTITSWLDAENGEIDESTRRMVARDSVVVLTRDGKKLETEELRWDNDLSKVVSDMFVKFTSSKSIVTGVGMRSDPALNNCEILSDVEIEVYEDDEELEQIQ
jgi:LPS export ABC transporter protein LptC